MTLALSTSDGKGIEVRFVHTTPEHEAFQFIPHGVDIGGHKLSLETFCAMAVHVLRGGFAGWYDKHTPEEVGNALSELFNCYEKRGEHWVLKDPATRM